MVEGWHSSSTFASTIACYIILLELDKILLDHHISNQTCGTGHSISCILCTLSTFDGNKLTRMFMGVSVIENLLSPQWRKSLLLFVQNFAGKLKMFKSVKSTITTEPPVESADRDCHRVLSRCVIIEAFSSAASASAAAIETRATPHCRLSGCCSNLSYLFAKYFYHRCSYNVADSKVQCLHRIFLHTKQCRAHLMLYSIMRIVQHLMCGRCVIINVIMI